MHQWGDQLYSLNAKFLVACLRLPAPLHVAVPDSSTRKLVYEYGSQRKSSLTMRSWRDLAEVTTIDAAPFSSFVFGDLYVFFLNQIIHFILSFRFVLFSVLN